MTVRVDIRDREFTTIIGSITVEDAIDSMEIEVYNDGDMIIETEDGNGNIITVIGEFDAFFDAMMQVQRERCERADADLLERLESIPS